MTDDAAAARRSDDALNLHAVESFDALFVTEYPKMVALAAAVSGTRAHAEDIAQEAMLRLDQSWSIIYLIHAQ